MTQDTLKQFAEKISNSILLTREGKLFIKNKMGAGEMTKEEMASLVRLLSLEDSVKDKVKDMIDKNYNN